MNYHTMHNRCQAVQTLNLLASIVSALFQSSPALADSPNLYVTGAAGFNNPTTRTNTGVRGTFEENTNPGASAELGLGIDFDGLRVEATYAIDASQLRGYTNVSGIDFDYKSGGEVRKQSGFLTGYWDLLRKSTWTPYLGAGFGYSNLDVRDFSDPGLSYKGFNRSLWGYQLKAGVSIDMSTHSILFAEGVYRGTSGFRTNDGFDNWNNASWSSWGGQMGVRISL